MSNLEFLMSILPFLLKGAAVSIFIALSASILGFIGGILLAVTQVGESRFLRILTTIFTTIIRGTPMLVQIMFAYLLLGSYLSAFTIAILAIGMNSSAYISQVIRSGIKSVSSGQIEAAKTLGISSYDITRYIVLPQALQVVIPALGNEFVTLIKDSSLASIIGVLELFKRGNIIISQTYSSIFVFIVVGLIYLILTSLLTGVMHIIETRLLNNDIRD